MLLLLVCLSTNNIKYCQSVHSHEPKRCSVCHGPRIWIGSALSVSVFCVWCLVWPTSSLLHFDRDAIKCVLYVCVLFALSTHRVREREKERNDKKRKRADKTNPSRAACVRESNRQYDCVMPGLRAAYTVFHTTHSRTRNACHLVVCLHDLIAAMWYACNLTWCMLHRYSRLANAQCAAVIPYKTKRGWAVLLKSNQ